MEFLNLTLGVPLGFFLRLAYQLTGDYGLAIIFFAVFARIILFPVSILAHKNSIRLLQLQPSLNAIKRQFSGDKASLNEAQYDLFKKEKYSPLFGVVPLLAQLVLIIGMLQVLYHPLQHILRIDQSMIHALVQAAQDIQGISGSGQLRVMAAFNYPEHIRAIQAALSAIPQADEAIQMTISMDLRFLGFSLGTVPSVFNPSIELLIPLLSGISALAFCLVQALLSPGALSQGKGANNALTIVTVGLSLYFAYALPVEVGIYWTVGNLAAIAVVLILDMLYPPKKLAGNALAYIRANRKSTTQLREERQLKRKLKTREKGDVAKFAAADKKLVFYALTGGQYKYYKNIIEYISANSDIVIHYLTNDPNDSLFNSGSNSSPNLIPYYASQKKTISLMLKLETDIMVTTVPDLQIYHMKRSLVRKDIEYIYVHHGLGSTHLAARETAYDHFDTIFCVGPHQVEEMRCRENMEGLPKKRKVQAGYSLYDQLVELYAEYEPDNNRLPQILIAPSWQPDNIMDICIGEMLNNLLELDVVVAIRPHPQFIQVFPERIDSLKSEFSRFVEEGKLVFDLDLLDNSSIYKSDILITDWSNIAFEFSFCTLRPSIFINTPIKILNPNYEDYMLVALEISLRDEVGISIDVGEPDKLKDTAISLLTEKDAYRQKIDNIVKQYVYYPGNSGGAGGTYIIDQLAK